MKYNEGEDLGKKELCVVAVSPSVTKPPLNRCTLLSSVLKTAKFGDCATKHNKHHGFKPALDSAGPCFI